MRLTPCGLRAFGRTIPVSTGRRGIVPADRKIEGDGATPAARLEIVGCLYRPDRVAPPSAWAEPILPGDLWCDDPGDAAYNHAVRAPFPASHEVMRRADSLYDIVLLTNWNWPDAVPGRGSAIFLHQWRRPGCPTAGCIAMGRGDLRWLAARAAPGTRLIVPQLSGAVPRRAAASPV